MLWSQSTSDSRRSKTSVMISPHKLRYTSLPRRWVCTHTQQRSLKLQDGPGGSESPGWPRDTHTRNHCSHTSAAGQLEGSAGPVQVPWRMARLGFCCPQALPARGPRGPAGGRWRWRLGTEWGEGGAEPRPAAGVPRALSWMDHGEDNRKGGRKTVRSWVTLRWQTKVGLCRLC